MRAALVLLGALLLALLTPPATARADSTTVATITNSDSSGNPLTWFDTDGNALDLHEPYLAFFNNTYYLYGTAMGCGSLSSIPAHTAWCGDKVYSSTDLTHWQYQGPLFDSTTAEWQNRCGLTNPFSSVSTQSSCFRPKVVYDAATGKYVLWVNFGVNSSDNASNPSTGKYYVLTSSSPTGPFTEVGAATLAQPWDNDETLFVDPATGYGYVTYMQQIDSSGNYHRLVVERLNSSFTSGTGQYAYVNPTTLNGDNRSEAPAMFERGGTYYLVYSTPPCGFCSQGVDTEYKTSTSGPLGPWSNPSPLTSGTPGASDFCPGQSSSVTPVSTTSGTSYLWQFDRWNTSGSSPATSTLFFDPLSFTSGGAINTVNCASVPSTQLTLSPGTPQGGTPAGQDRTSGSDGFYDHCDIYGTRVRSQAFTPSSAAVGKSMTVALDVNQENAPNAPLVLDLKAADSSGTPTGPVLASSSIDPSGVSWSSHTATVVLPTAVASGQSYAVLVHSATSQGCYSVQFHNGQVSGTGAEHFSNDSGGSWSAAEPYTLKFATFIGPDPATTPGSGSSAAFAFDEGHGTTAADSTGSGNTATLLGGADWAPSWGARNGTSALTLNGNGEYAEVPRPVIDTGQSFTVSAWVDLARTDDNAYAVASVDGSQQSGFYLEYCGFCNGGAFDLTMTNSDAHNASAVRATGTTHPAAGTWYHLVGVYDAGAGTLSLYVNGTKEATSSYSSGWTAHGPTAIGRAQYNGAYSNYWPGSLDDVRFNAGVLAP
jgi:hypothetical protein